MPARHVDHASTPSRFAGPAVRCLATAMVLAIVLASSGGTLSAGLAAILGLGLIVIVFDKRHPVSMRNFFVVYTVALFCLGVPLFDLGSDLYADMVLFVVVFLSGYAVSSARKRDQVEVRTETVPTAYVTHAGHRIRTVEELMLVVAGLQILLLAVNISRYGIGGFYGGQGLVDQLSTYGQASVTGGVLQIFTFLVKYTTIAVVVIYVQLCLQARMKIRYRYLLLVLVAIPILSLARSDALHGAGLLVVINAVARRFSARTDSASEGGTEAGHADRIDPPSRLAPRRTFAIAATMVVALLAGLAIGGLRQNRLTPQTSSSALERSLPLLQSEVTPIRAYSEIKENEDVLERQHGATIVLPVIFKVVPRGIFPDKPINSGAYFMSVVRPAEFAAGFALPPTLFGDAYLNFGMGGAVLACLLVGLAAARLDVAYKEVRISRLPWFLIVYANFYALVRSPLSETLAGVLLTAAAWAVLSHLLGVRSGPGHVGVEAAVPFGHRRPGGEVQVVLHRGGGHRPS